MHKIERFFRLKSFSIFGGLKLYIKSKVFPPPIPFRIKSEDENCTILVIFGARPLVQLLKGGGDRDGGRGTSGGSLDELAAKSNFRPIPSSGGIYHRDRGKPGADAERIRRRAGGVACGSVFLGWLDDDA